MGNEIIHLLYKKINLLIYVLCFHKTSIISLLIYSVHSKKKSTINTDKVWKLQK